jgi:hypothetical protein
LIATRNATQNESNNKNKLMQKCARKCSCITSHGRAFSASPDKMSRCTTCSPCQQDQREKFNAKKKKRETKKKKRETKKKKRETKKKKRETLASYTAPIHLLADSQPPASQTGGGGLFRVFPCSTVNNWWNKINMKQVLPSRAGPSGGRQTSLHISGGKVVKLLRFNFRDLSRVANASAGVMNSNWFTSSHSVVSDVSLLTLFGRRFIRFLDSMMVVPA